MIVRVGGGVCVVWYVREVDDERMGDSEGDKRPAFICLWDGFVGRAHRARGEVRGFKMRRFLDMTPNLA